MGMTYGVPGDTQEQRAAVIDALREWGHTEGYHAWVTMNILEQEGCAAALHCVATMREMEEK